MVCMVSEKCVDSRWPIPWCPKASKEVAEGDAYHARSQVTRSHASAMSARRSSLCARTLCWACPRRLTQENRAQEPADPSPFSVATANLCWAKRRGKALLPGWVVVTNPRQRGASLQACMLLTLIGVEPTHPLRNFVATTKLFLWILSRSIIRRSGQKNENL